MKIQKWLLASVLGFSLVSASGAWAQSFKVDTSQSEIEWKGTKIGGSHEGTIKFQSGNLTFKDNVLSGGELVVDMNSIVNTDLPSEKKKGQLVGHLKSDDFFAVSEHPTAKIVFTDVTKKDGENYEIKGDFTVRGTTKPITFNAKIDMDESEVEGEAELSFDRSEHNVKYNSGSFFENLGDKLIHDDIQLDIDLTAKK